MAKERIYPHEEALDRAYAKVPAEFACHTVFQVLTLAMINSDDEIVVGLQQARVDIDELSDWALEIGPLSIDLVDRLRIAGDTSGALEVMRMRSKL
jgi:hypothetical protein